LIASRKSAGVEEPDLLPDERWEGESVERWARWWGVPSLLSFHSLPSTSDHLRSLAGMGADPFTVVLAETQSRGRGRGGKGWSSPPGMGLWMSVLLEQHGSSAALPILPLRVGLALAEAVGVVVPGLTLGLKWPNDLMVDGRKAAGILCELVHGASARPRIVVGVGVNLRQEPGDFAPDLRRSSVSLGWAAGYSPDRTFLLGTFLSILREGVGSSSSCLSMSEQEALQELDHLRGRAVRVDPGGEGMALGIAEDGALLVDMGGASPRRVMAGSVRFLDASQGEER